MRVLRRGAALLLSVVMTLGLLGGALLVKAGADEAKQWEDAKLGELSKLYETGNVTDPGVYATTPGDPGGVSFGLYMFASNVGEYGTPYDFMKWCQKSDESVYRQIGIRLEEAYKKGGIGYGPNFKAEWKQIALDYPGTFASAQYDFVKVSIYDVLVEKVEAAIPNFDMDDYSIALQNVFWSRAVHHGANGALSVIENAFDEGLGGFANQPEAALIQAIYAESGKVGSRGSNTMSGDTAKKYGVNGKTVYFFYGSSGAVQMGVYTRLRVNEPADALVMLMNNGDCNAVVANGTYQMLRYDNQKLAVDVSGGVKLAASSPTDAQYLTLCYYAGGRFYTLCDKNGNRLSEADGGEVTMALPSTSAAQQWTLEKNGSGYALKNVKTGNDLAYLGNTVCTSAMVAPDKENAATPTSTLTSTPTSTPTSSPTSTPETQEVTSAVWQFNSLPTVRTDGLIYPAKDNILVAGNSSFPVRGVISSAAKIQKVQILVKNASTGAEMIKITRSPQSHAYDLKLMDTAVTYSALPAGDYTFALNVTIGDVTTCVANSAFTVTKNTGAAVSDETFTVTFDAGKGTLSGSSSITAKLNSVYGTLPTASIEGGTFLGWFTEDGDEITANTVVRAANLKLVARYSTLRTYTFLKADGSTSFFSGQVAEGELIPAPSTTPAKAPSGSYTYKFSRWEGYEKNVTVMGKEDVTFTPIYTKTAISTDGGSTGGSTGGGSTGGGSTGGGSTGGGSTGGGSTGGGSTGGSTGGGSSSGYWDGIAPGTSVGELSGTVYSKSGSVVTSGRVGTGMTVSVSGSTYTIVVKGDTDGDGKCSIVDVVKLQSHLVGKASLSGAYVKAADIDGNGSVGINDLVTAARVVSGKLTIS